MYKNIALILSLITVFFISPVYAAESDAKEEVKAAEVNPVFEISEAWARTPLSPNNNSAAYMVINNPTDQQITIIGASTMVANNVELHESFVDDKGVSRMKSIDNIVVPAQSKIELKPGAIHIMLFDLKKAISSGDKFNMELKIKDMKPITVEVVVK